MTFTVPATPRAVRHISLVIGELEYNLHVNSFAVTPTTPQVNWKGGTPEAAFSDSGTPTYVGAVAVVHDYQNPESLYNILLEHQGEKAEITYKPDISGWFAATTEVTLVAPVIGGPVDQFNQSTVSMPASKPVRATAAPAEPDITSINPATGLPAGLVPVELLGTGFTGATLVTIGGNNAQFTIINDRRIIAILPPHAAGAVTATVTTPEGTSDTIPFTYAA